MSDHQQKIQTTVNAFAGKTIREIRATSVNMWTIFFTDGEFLSLETEYFGYPGLYGIVPNLKDTLPLPQKKAS